VVAENLTVALAQTAARPGDVKGNVESAAGLIRQAADAGADLLVFPELSLVGYDLVQLADPSVWVTPDDPRLDPIRRPALATVVGAPFHGGEGARLLAALVLQPDGRMAVHGKRNLHGPEREWFRAGEPAGLLEIGGWRIATAICYDAGIPAHAQDAADRGAEVYAASVLYTQDEVRRFDLHLAARAMDHRMYALAANHAGTGPGWESCGGSGVWHPDGRRVLQAGTEPVMLTCSLSRADLDELRKRDAAAGYPKGQSA
jgi:predicted amidohydrolase